MVYNHRILYFHIKLFFFSSFNSFIVFCGAYVEKKSVR
uniref:Uncharacterized protein n=1 Tax=Anguilla anguilla TaxID=7936 RepID=A0A0E9PA30_ANGAN